MITRHFLSSFAAAEFVGRKINIHLSAFETDQEDSEFGPFDQYYFIFDETRQPLVDRLTYLRYGLSRAALTMISEPPEAEQ